MSNVEVSKKDCPNGQGGQGPGCHIKVSYDITINGSCCAHWDETCKGFSGASCASGTIRSSTNGVVHVIQCKADINGPGDPTLALEACTCCGCSPVDVLKASLSGCVL